MSKRARRAVLVAEFQLQRIRDGLCFDCGEPGEVGVYCRSCFAEWVPVGDFAVEVVLQPYLTFVNEVRESLYRHAYGLQSELATIEEVSSAIGELPDLRTVAQPQPRPTTESGGQG